MSSLVENGKNKNSFAVYQNHAHPIYTGSKVKDGKFSITCLVNIKHGPIAWHQDGKLIESQSILNPADNGSYYESTLTIKNANIRHKGKYHCIKDDSVTFAIDLPEETFTENPIIQIVNKFRINGKPDLTEFPTDSETFLNEDDEDDYFEKPNRSMESMTSTIDSDSHHSSYTENTEIDENDFDDENDGKTSEESTTKMELPPPIILTTSTTTENGFIETTSFPLTSTVLIESTTTSIMSTGSTTTTYSDEELQTPLSIKNQGSK